MSNSLMIIHTARSLLRRLKCFSNTTSADVYEELYDTTVSLFETWLTASDTSNKVIIGLDDVIQQLKGSLSSPTVSAADGSEEVDVNEETSTSISPALATDIEYNSLASPTENPSSDPLSVSNLEDSPFNSDHDELPNHILAS